MLSLAFWGGALALAFAIGAYHGREKERRRIVAGDFSRWEAELLRAQRIRMHPNPAAAGKVSRARFVR